MDEENGQQRALNPADREDVRISLRIRRILDPFAISAKELSEDSFLGEESVEEFLQRPPPGQSS
jgi:hypothetical protein